jgi:hypothetical protein
MFQVVAEKRREITGPANIASISTRVSYWADALISWQTSPHITKTASNKVFFMTGSSANLFAKEGIKAIPPVANEVSSIEYLGFIIKCLKFYNSI